MVRDDPSSLGATTSPMRRIIEMFKGHLPIFFARAKVRPFKNLGRSEYKRIWNSVSISEDQAKLAVSGYTDEGTYRESGQYTLRLLQESVGLSKDDVVLEVGAGVGRVGAMVAPLCREWIGTDVSENMVRHMQRRLAHCRNARAIATNGINLDGIPSESVDVVYCTVVFMHLEEWERYSYIVEGFRVLKPGGRMLVDNVNLLSDEGWAFFEKHRAIAPEDRPAQISKTSTPQELDTYFRRAGFCDIRQVEFSLWIVTHGRKPTNSLQADCTSK